MRRLSQFQGAPIVVVFAMTLPVPAAAAGTSVSPISGTVRAAGHAVPGASVLIRAQLHGAGAISRSFKAEPDGTFVFADAPAGLYTIVTSAPGYRPAVAKVLHRADGGIVSFVPLDLEPAGGILPKSALSGTDPWSARAVVRGDVLREMEAVAARADEPMPALPASTIARAEPVAASTAVRAQLSSLAGFDSAADAKVSRTALDVEGGLGKDVHFGVAGQYSRSVSGVGVADARRIALDVSPSQTQAIRFTTRQKVLGGRGDSTEDPTLEAHSIDWSADGASSRASVTARMNTQANLVTTGPTADLFARNARAIEVAARYKSDIGQGDYVRVHVAYRTSSGLDATGESAETFVGGTAALRVFDVILLEGGATGDFSNRVRAVTPELTVALHAADGVKIYGFASRRLDRSYEDPAALGMVSFDEEDILRHARLSYRAGIQWQSEEGSSLVLEGQQREIGGTYRYILRPDLADRNDSLYFFEGDVVTEVMSASTFRLGSGLGGRLTARAGRITGSRDASVARDAASYALAEGAVEVAATRTSLGVGYRVVNQSLSRGAVELRNDLNALDVTFAQTLPISFLRTIGSEARALLSLEYGKRREGAEPERLNKQLSGGLALAF